MATPDDIWIMIRYLLIFLCACSAQAVPVAARQNASLYYGLQYWWTFNAGVTNKVTPQAGTNEFAFVGPRMVVNGVMNYGAQTSNGISYLVCPPINFYPTNSDMTVSVWVNPTVQTLSSPTSNPRIIAMSASATNFWQIGMGNANVVRTNCFYAIMGTNSAYIAGTISYNNTYHIAVTFRMATQVMQIYINGINTALTNMAYAAIGSSGTTDSKIYLGVRPDTVGDYSGMIDDLRIYNRVLSAAEIQALATPAQ